MTLCPKPSLYIRAVHIRLDGSAPDIEVDPQIDAPLVLSPVVGHEGRERSGEGVGLRFEQSPNFILVTVVVQSTRVPLESRRSNDRLDGCPDESLELAQERDGDPSWTE
jgi:hypothetical protein